MALQAGTKTSVRSRPGTLFRIAIGIAVIGLLLAGAAIVVHGDEASASSHETFVVSLGDRIQVASASVACRVTRLERRGLRPYVECRRSGALEGTYSAFFSGKDVVVARFLDSREARVVFRRSHFGSLPSCG